MAKKNQVKKQGALGKKEAEDRRRFLEMTRKILLAPVGAMGLAQDELEGFIKKLAQWGDIADKDARKLLKEVRAKRPKHAPRGLSKQVDKLRPPSKADIDRLSEQVSKLSAKVDKLTKKRTAA